MCYAEAVGPPVLHRQQRRDCKDNNKPKQSAILGKMHEKQESESGLDAGYDQHPGEHRARIHILISDDELDGSQH